VIGREFTHQLLAAVADRSEAELQAALDQLVASALMFRRGVPPETAYSFKHALVRDAAYGTLLRPHRQQLHAQIATALEERFPETADAHPELLAHHFTEAGETERAVDYWSKAGTRARERSAYTEAIAHLDTGLELLKPFTVSAKRHQRELKLQKDRALALQATRGHSAPEVGKAFAKARQLCRELGDPSEIFPVLRGLHNFHWTRAEHGIALEIGQECLNLAKNQKEGAAEVLAHRLIGQAKFMLGELNAGRKHLQRAIDQYDSGPHGDSTLEYGADSKLVARVLLSQLLWVVGYPDRACGEADATLRDAKSQEGKYDLVHTEWQRLFTQFLRRDYRAVLENAKSVSASAREHGVDPFALSAEALNCWARLADSKRGEDIGPFAESIKARRATGAMIRVPILLGSLAEGLAANARVKEALATVAEALELTDERWSDAELHRLKGEILLRLDDLDTAKKAEASFRASLDIAQRQGARSWELRAATSFARLWRDQGKRAQAHDLLAPVYGWFSEGFDSADLKEAKALLDELA
jgi:predicted ATPase